MHNFQKEGNKYSDAEKCILSSMCIWHMGSRRYISDLHVVTIGTRAFGPPWHQGLYSGEKKSMSTLYPVGDSLLHVGVCCKTVTTQVLVKRSKEMENTATSTSNRTWDWYGPTECMFCYGPTECMFWYGPTECMFCYGPTECMFWYGPTECMLRTATLRTATIRTALLRVLIACALHHILCSP
jgi:hypothetical protein